LAPLCQERSSLAHWSKYQRVRGVDAAPALRDIRYAQQLAFKLEPVFS